MAFGPRSCCSGSVSSLGKALSVNAEEFRAFACRTVDRLLASGPSERADADFAPAFGCEACTAKSGRIIPTEFQLITGSGHQFFLETLGKLMETVSEVQFHRASRTLDLCRSATLVQMDRSMTADMPSVGTTHREEVRTEHGANLLAAFAIPLFPVIPTTRGPVTTGFHAESDRPRWSWPLWRHPSTLDAIRSLLASFAIQELVLDRPLVSILDVAEVFRTNKIEVGRPPLSKLNLTPAVPA